MGAKLTPDQLHDADAIVKATKSESIPIVGAVLVVCVLYFVARKLTAPKATAWRRLGVFTNARCVHKMDTVVMIPSV